MLKIIIWDVEQGSATFVETPNQTRIVQDLGVGSWGNQEFSPLNHLRSRGNLPQIDALILTHPHRDHIADIETLHRVPVGELYRPQHLSADQLLSENRNSSYWSSVTAAVVDVYLQFDARFPRPKVDVTSPLRPQNNGGVKFSVFYPHCPGDCNLNNHSLICVIEYCGFKIVIPGDNEDASWDALLSESRFRSAIEGANVLVAAHHGRRSGFYPDLFNYLEPDPVIISDGPQTETNVSSCYSEVAGPYPVWHRIDQLTDRRRCVTTRSDGVVYINIDDSGNWRVNID